VEYGIATTNSGYIIEIALPWLTMIGEEAKGGRLIGIDVTINDDDDGGDRDTQLSWHTTIAPPHDPSKWGTAVLGIIKSYKARNPSPADKAIEVPRDAILSWKPGQFADKHNLYFGKDLNDVNQASIANPHGVLVRQNYDDTSYTPPSLLDFNQTYYWRVDEVNDFDPNSPWIGNLWSFTVVNYTVVDDFEGYDDVNNLIYDVWADYAVNNTGMTVGHLKPPFAEQTIVHKGKQAMYMRYDNDGTVNEGNPDYEKSGTLLYSEAQRQWADAQDWTKDGTDSLTIWFRGLIGAIGSFTLGPPIRMTGLGTDIGGSADQFCYAYKMLSGNGSITAKVLSVTNTDSLAKAGVMMRESLTAGSKHFTTVASPGNRVSFVRRSTTNGTAVSTSKTGVTIPVWVRITRSGNTFTSHYSANGTTWTAVGTPQEFQMPVDVYVGLCVTSRKVSAICTAEFSDVSIIGTVKGDWKSQDIGLITNAPEQLYVAIQDSSNNSAVVKHSNAAATIITTWTQWDIPLSAFTGVNLQSIKMLSIGVGDRASTQRGGAGDLYIDDIVLKLP
jgi:regulation of enolase protein 1 (concanavalin A-like superfamily)